MTLFVVRLSDGRRNPNDSAPCVLRGIGATKPIISYGFSNAEARFRGSTSKATNQRRLGSQVYWRETGARVPNLGIGLLHALMEASHVRGANHVSGKVDSLMLNTLNRGFDSRSRDGRKDKSYRRIYGDLSDDYDEIVAGGFTSKYLDVIEDAVHSAFFRLNIAPEPNYSDADVDDVVQEVALKMIEILRSPDFVEPTDKTGAVIGLAYRYARYKASDFIRSRRMLKSSNRSADELKSVPRLVLGMHIESYARPSDDSPEQTWEQFECRCYERLTPARARSAIALAACERKSDACEVFGVPVRTLTRHKTWLQERLVKCPHPGCGTMLSENECVHVDNGSVACEQCGKQYHPHCPIQRHCSEACHKKATVRWTRRCPHCDESFRTTREDKVYCSKDCQTYAAKTRKLERQKERMERGMMKHYRDNNRQAVLS